MFTKEYKELLKAIWPMCRKNELYTEEMFIQDITGMTKTLLSKHIGEVEGVIKPYKVSTGHLSCSDMNKAIGSNNRLADIKKRLEL